jgi:gamma-glutamylcyclotransferase (GGCT)/AIG2-like uncharacterized protein YtfP
MTQTRNLFVYGTLRPSAAAHMGRAMRRRLMAESTYLGPAKFPGRLLDLGRYPGLVEHAPNVGPEAAALPDVIGDLVALRDPDRTWPWLDAYEDFDHARPVAGLYGRVLREIFRADGESCEAWVYVLLRHPPRIRVVETGDWLKR